MDMSEATLVTPFWFAQRQLKAEAVGEDYFRIHGPNIADSYVGIRRLDDGTYQGYFRREEDGADNAVTTVALDTPYNAWEGAFELYREEMIL